MTLTGVKFRLEALVVRAVFHLFRRLPIDAASEVEEACKALPHRLVIILHPPE